MIIQNVTIFTEEQEFRPGSIEIRGDKFRRVSLEENAGSREDAQAEETVIDGRGCYAIPGMIDLHFHGCMGRDACDLPGEEDGSELWRELADYQASIGVTAMAPALMTIPENQLKRTLENAAAFAQMQKEGKAKGALLAGINMEGPFISREKCGAQDASFISPCNIGLAEEFLRAGRGLVRILGVAPEQENALRMIEGLKDRVRISLAHTAADYETAKQAIEAGACHVTHLFNAMPGWDHRNPGVIGAAADAVAEGKDITAELICDGAHVHPSMIRTAFHLFGKEHLVLISDSMRAAGMPEGTYTLGGQEVAVKDGKAVLKKDGSLAGSVVSLPDCVRYAIKSAGISPRAAIAAATINPARCLGIADLHGSIAAGKYADLLLWDKELCQTLVICRGEIL